MRDERDDAELREQFQRLRRQDERLARPFSAFRLAARQRPRAGSRGLLRYRLAAAALGLALVAGMGALHLLRPHAARFPDEAAIARLSRWRAPTDGLLRAPGDQLLRGVPRLGESVIDGNFFGGMETR
jgi:hypothetical protein